MTSFAISDTFVAGMDVGGTKIQLVDTLSTTVWRYPTADFQDLYAVLDAYFEKMQAQPCRMMIGMAGPRDDATGRIGLTNHNWPTFDPQEAQQRYPGTEFATANDMVVTTAGVIYGNADLLTLKSGMPTAHGTKVVVTISTGVGVAAAAWDERSDQYVIMQSEAGHIGVQPKTEGETRYVQMLLTKYPHVSGELALSGKHGLGNLIDYLLPSLNAPELSQAIQHAREMHQPPGAALLEFATEGTGASQAAARRILGQLGAMVGSLLHDHAVAFKASGGIYLTGSVSLALAEYFAAETDFADRFVCEGAAHADWVKDIPIYLLPDPYIAASGALALARGI